MELQKITFEQAQILKELGFIELCNYFFTIEGRLIINSFVTSFNQTNDEDFIDAPEIALVIKWLREVHKININVFYELEFWNCNMFLMDKYEILYFIEGVKTYEEAESKGLDKVLEYLIRLKEEKLTL